MSEGNRVVYVRDDSGSNATGLVGFILSLLGLLGTCGLFSPVGLVVSLVGLGKRPRGFAIAGVVLGAIGSIWLIVGFVIALIGLLIVGAAGVAAVVGAAAETGSIEAAWDRYEVIRIVDGLGSYEEAHGALPTMLDQLEGLDAGALEDRWSTPYHYRPDFLTGEFQIFSDGPDQQRGTDDDILLFDSAAPEDERLKLDDDPAFEELERRLNDHDDDERAGESI